MSMMAPPPRDLSRRVFCGRSARLKVNWDWMCCIWPTMPDFSVSMMSFVWGWKRYM